MTEFHFHTKQDLTVLLGVRASTAMQLLEAIRTVPDDSIYFHTHKFLHTHHYLSPEPSNDFAYWTTASLVDAPLGEKLSSVDIVQFESIAALRKEMGDILENHLAASAEPRRAPEGAEFHFMGCQTFVVPTSVKATAIQDFSDALNRVSLNSLYYHMFDAKLRLERGENDLSAWFRGLGKNTLADEVRKLDPYAYTLESLRRRILVLVKQHAEA